MPCGKCSKFKALGSEKSCGLLFAVFYKSLRRVIGFSTRTNCKDIDRKALANLSANLAPLSSNKSVEHGDSAHWWTFFLYNSQLPECNFCLNPQCSSQKTRTSLPAGSCRTCFSHLYHLNALPLRNDCIQYPQTYCRRTDPQRVG